MATCTLAHINQAAPDDVLTLLEGLYEHSPWIVQRALVQRPFASAAHFKYACTQVVDAATPDEQLALIRAHPELAGKAMVDHSLTAASTDEQSRAGLTRCTPEEFQRLQALNTTYNQRFGHPFILAVRGPRGTGLTKADILAAFERRLHHHPDAERAECLRNIHRIAEIRLADKLGQQPEAGNWVWDALASLAVHSEPPYAQAGQLTVTYLSDAHRACAAQIAQAMRDCGCDHVHQDAVGNVVGRYESDSYTTSKHGGHPLKTPRTLLTGSHYDTVHNAGRLDGRLGIFVPLAVVRQLHQQGRRLPFALEVVAFAEEEGQRFPATFLGSSALTGHFQSAWLEQTDAQGVRLTDALRQAGLDASRIAEAQRNPADYLGFVEVHIEQGPVLCARHLPLGVVTAINASARYLCEVVGTASHAGTTPMDRRRDAAVAVAELLLYVEERARADGDSVGTVGQLQVPQGSINVVPGSCQFSLDLRAPNNTQRDALARDVMERLRTICERRGLQYTALEALRASAAHSHPTWQARWERAVATTGLPVLHLPSGAGHDAMQLHTCMPQAMLFVRGENDGISHNPLESSTSDDIDLAVQAFAHLLDDLALTPDPTP